MDLGELFMSVTIRYAAFVIFLIVVFAVVYVLKDGIQIRNGGGGPIVEQRG